MTCTLHWLAALLWALLCPAQSPAAAPAPVVRILAALGAIRPAVRRAACAQDGRMRRMRRM
ncbi:MAG TPA: hypothetical protein IAB73_11195 [Candidatus Onthenecus intestinigallinarum]|uniref:Uncharacterized protein n=1 Tax=Candidatus Onthenecus intestinigallinarum TaxID=2840875 RepID=A0A9D0ZC95_9FIRM|nr:hypothetical protein [Candidatus Onthenecus intestinigallinarum]